MIVLAVVTVAIGIVLLVFDYRMRDSGGPGIVTFEFAGTVERAVEIQAEWGDEGEDFARASLWLEYPYVLAYGAFLVLACAATRDLAAGRGWRPLEAAAIAAVPMAAGAAALDAIEDAALLLVLGGHGGEVAPPLAFACASLKFLFLGLVLVYLAGGLVLRFVHRGS
jgi:hypothetical protein